MKKSNLENQCIDRSMFKDDIETFKVNLPIGFMSKKRTGVLRMAVNMRSCRDCAHLTSTLNRNMFLINPKTIVAIVKPIKKKEKQNIFFISWKKACTSLGIGRLKVHFHITSINTQVEVSIQLFCNIFSILGDSNISW